MFYSTLKLANIFKPWKFKQKAQIQQAFKKYPSHDTVSLNVTSVYDAIVFRLQNTELTAYLLSFTSKTGKLSSNR